MRNWEQLPFTNQFTHRTINRWSTGQPVTGQFGIDFASRRPWFICRRITCPHAICIYIYIYVYSHNIYIYKHCYTNANTSTYDTWRMTHDICQSHITNDTDTLHTPITYDKWQMADDRWHSQITDDKWHITNGRWQMTKDIYIYIYKLNLHLLIMSTCR